MFFLVPHDVGTDWATIWLGAADETAKLESMSLQPADLAWDDPTPVKHWPAQGRARLQSRRITLRGLKPRTQYRLALLDSRGWRAAEASVTTLPSALPAGGKPFTVMLGSCYWHEEDKGKLRQTFERMSHIVQPEIKLLTGDQVYLDMPLNVHALKRFSGRQLDDVLLDGYLHTWDRERGLGRVLQQGANYFCADDHELWNDAPAWTPLVRTSWFSDGRRQWLESGRELFAEFQSPSTISSFDVSPVSFLLAETRLHRSADRTSLFRAGDLDKVADWIADLTGPGVLALGQPLLQGPSPLHYRLFDASLPDFTEYHELARILGGSRHSLVIVTGDVHFGRIAKARLRSDAELIEIIASPMALNHKKAEGRWEEAPATFPAAGLRGAATAAMAPVAVETFTDHAQNVAHFKTLEFTRRGSGADMVVRYWPVGATPGVTSADFGKPIWKQRLN